MAAGVPAVATDVGDVVNMVAREGRGLIVAPDDEAGLAAALDALVGDPTRRVALGAANRARALAEYGEAAMIDRYSRIYGEAIGDPRALTTPRA